MLVNEELVVNSPWFHGTTANLPVGTVLTPGVSRGVNNFLPAGDNTRVFGTKDFDAACTWAKSAARGKKWFIYAITPGTVPVEGKPAQAEWLMENAIIVGLAYTNGSKWVGQNNA